MSNIQSKLHKVTKSFQKGYEKNVNKFQTSQEVLKLKENISQNEGIRFKLVVSIGEKYYFKYRNGELKGDNDIEEICSKILDLDKKIFRDLKTIEEKTKNDSENIICECGAPLTSDDKFCRNCGKNIENLKKEFVEKVICSNCKEEIPVDSKYCNCCGMKLS